MTKLQKPSWVHWLRSYWGLRDKTLVKRHSLQIGILSSHMIGILLHRFKPINVELLGETYSVKCFDKLVTYFLHLTDDGAKP